MKVMTLGCGKPELLANINDNKVRHKSRFYLPVKQNKTLCLVCSPILRVIKNPIKKAHLRDSSDRSVVILLRRRRKAGKFSAGRLIDYR